ncbi:MAG TPA: ThiF family adenylyltransferase [Tepidisphaeraceae bacterium]|nr:ThiF family adenylyltransferase [Tepidisphaeraceae bacterium]
MPGKFHHESLYRGDALLEHLATSHITLCGAGAVGSNLADALARQGVAHLRVIDHDRVEEHNVSTQIYGEGDVGVWKVEALRNRLFRTVGVEIGAMRKELSAANARQLLKDSELIVDAFDNAASRQLVQDHARATATPCLHVGLFEDYGEVVWDERYRVPRDVGNDVCDYPLARNLVLLATLVAAEAVVRFIMNGERVSWTATLRDLAVRPMDD